MAKKPEERRTSYLSVTMTPSERAQIDKAAEAAGQSSSTYALRSVMAQVERDKKKRK